MKVYFVMGPVGAGKSTYIKNYFPPNSIIIDIYDFQKEMIKNRSILNVLDMDSLLLAEKACLNSLIDSIKDSKDKDTVIVLEHTMCFNTRKKVYLHAARKAGAQNVEGICIKPCEKEYIKRLNEKLPDISPLEKELSVKTFRNFESPPNGWFDKLTFVI